MKKIFRIQNKIYSTKLKLIGDKNNLLNKDIIVEFNNELNTKMNLKDIFKHLLFFKPGNAIFFDNKGTIFQRSQKPGNRKFISQKYKYSKNYFFEDILGYKYIFKPIINFDFYCHIHGEKNIFYCTDCKIHLCNKCIKLFSLFSSSKESKKELLIFLCLKKNMKIISENKLKKISKYINNLKDIDEELNTRLKYKKSYKHDNSHKIIELNKLKLSDNEIQYYTQNIEKVSKILENSKNSSNYEINMLLLDYCKMYIEFYQSNLKLGLNYNIIYSIRNNIKFNENFLNHNIKEDNNSLILNLSYDDKNEKFFLLKPSETFNLKTSQKILFITISPDLSEVLLGFNNKLKIFNFKPFQLNSCIYISSKNAKYLSNGNLIVLQRSSYSSTIILFKNKNKKDERITLDSNGYFYEDNLIIDIPENRYFSYIVPKFGRYDDKIILIYNYQNQLVQEINTHYRRILNLLYLSKFDCFFCFGYNRDACLSIYRKNNFSYEFVNKFDYIQFFDFMNDQFLINKRPQWYYDCYKYYNIVCCKNKIIYNNNKYLNELDIEEKEKNDKEIMCERKIDNQKLRYEYLTKRNEIIFWEITNNKDNNDNVYNVLNFYIYSP